MTTSRTRDLSAAKRLLLEQRIRGGGATRQTAAEPDLRPSKRPARVPLSLAQERLWLLDELEAEKQAYNLSWVLMFDGGTDPLQLKRALEQIVERHEALRTRLPCHDGVPFQDVMPANEIVVSKPPIPEDFDRPRVRRAAKSYANASAAIPFDLKTEPAVRLEILDLGRWGCSVVLTAHHIAFDGWSFSLFKKELTEIHGALKRGESHELAPLPVQFADFALWERADGAGRDTALRFWSAQLRDTPGPVPLPTDRPRSPSRESRAETLTFTLDRALAERIDRLVTETKCTEFMFLLTGFLILLHKLAGREDIVVASPVANRDREGLDRLMGLFVDMVFLRNTVDPRLTVAGQLARVRRATLATLQHRRIPFGELAGQLKTSLVESRREWMQFLFAYQSFPSARLAVDGEAVHLDHLAAKYAMSEVSVTVTRQGEPFVGAIAFDSGLHDRSSMERLAQRYCRLLSDLASAPDKAVGDFDLLLPAERATQTVDWAGEEDRRLGQIDLPTLFEAQASGPGRDATALIQAGRRMTYGELDRRANRLAHRLGALGAAAESIVAVRMARSIEMVVALLAVLKTGAAYLPLEPTGAAARDLEILESAAPIALLCGAEGPGLAPPDPLPTIQVDLDGEESPSLPATPPPRRIDPSSLAYVIYTSGSTGRPKGVMVPHRGMANVLASRQRRCPIGAGDRALFKAHYSTDFSVIELFWPLSAGAAVVIAEAGKHNDPEYLCRLIADHRVSDLDLVPAALRLLAECESFVDCSTLARVFSGGEAIRPGDVDVFGACSRARLYNTYGPTETSVEATHASLPDKAGGPVPIGRPIHNLQLFVLDDRLRPQPIGTAGELFIGGAGVARGYLGQPGLTAARFVPSPFASGERLYRTGDLGRWRGDGQLECLGRTDDQLKLRGYRIEPGEIEARLSEHPGVRDAAVTVRNDRQGEPQLVAYVVPDPNCGRPDQDELRGFLRRRLPDFMVPTFVAEATTLPLNRSGKKDRKALPELVPSARRRRHAAPRGALETRIAQVWAGILGRHRVGRDESFFDLGGHSLLAARITARLAKEIGQPMPLSALFESPTVARLAAKVAAGAFEAALVETLRAGEARSAASLVCAHTAMGTAQAYKPLARSLSFAGPILATNLLQPAKAGAAGSLAGNLAGSLEDAMAPHAAALDRLLPTDAPAALLGWSIGGVIAYELAQKLCRLGRRVPLVIMIDSVIPRIADPVPSVEAVAESFARSLPKRHGRAISDIVREVTSGGEGDLALLYARFRQTAAMARRYVPRPFSGRIVLLRSRQGKSAATLEWQASALESLVGDRLRIADLDASHYELLRSPCVESLARSVDAALRTEL